MIKKIISLVKENYQIVLIILFAFLVYYKSIFFGFTDLDDTLLISSNLTFLSNINNIFNTFVISVFEHLHVRDEFYRPLMLISLIVDTQFSSYFPGIYHLTNIFIHVVNVFLLYLFFRILNVKKNISLLLCLLFSIHPTLVHAISWIPGRNDTLLTLFVLSYFVFLAKYLLTNNKIYLSFIFISFFLAVFTKETGLLCIVLTYIYFYLFEKEKISSRFTEIIVGNVLIILAWLLLRQNAIKIPANITFREDIIAFSRNVPGLFVYLGKIIPIDLSTLPSFRLIPFITGVTILLIFTLTILLQKEKDIKLIIFGATFFILFLTPSFYGSNPDISFPFFEHRLYLPIIGIMLIISQLKYVEYLLRKRNIFLLVIIAGVFVYLNIRHQSNYKDAYSFWNNAVATSPENASSHFGMGTYYCDQKDLENCEKELLLAINLNPKQGGIRNNLGLVYLDQGKLDDALKIFKEELKISETPSALHNYGLALYYSGDYLGAERYWLKVLEIDPDHILTLEKMYRLRVNQKNIFDAEYFKKELIKRNIKI